MKKRKLILIGLLIWNFNSVFGQNFCFTPSTSSNLSLNSSYQMRSSNNNSYCLKIYFHVIRRSNGTAGIATSLFGDFISVKICKRQLAETPQVNEAQANPSTI